MSKQSRIVTPTDDETKAYGGGEPANSAGDEKANPSGAAEAQTAPRNEADEWRDKFLRARAELANYQKRAEKDRSDAIRYAHAELARALLPLLDDLGRLIESAGEQNVSLPALVEGVRLTQENFLKVLEQFHVLPIEAQGQPFDPNVHEAIMQQPSEQHTNLPVVLREIARGFTLFDRVLRPAKVIVSRSIAVSPEHSESD